MDCYACGKVKRLKVIPESRDKDIVILNRRIKLDFTGDCTK